jgi:cbb3-type cytochrome oxidase subunit 3
VTGPAPRSRAREVFADRGKRDTPFAIATTMCLAIQVSHLTHVLDRAPEWVTVIGWAVLLVVVTPVFIGYVVFTLRDARRRKRHREASDRNEEAGGA